MKEEIEAHIAAVEGRYRPLLVGTASRLQGGERLWRQFDDAVRVYREAANAVPLIEKVNELVVAGVLLKDPTYAGRAVRYEANILPDGRRIDFDVPASREGATVYYEVKTVRPRTEDNDANWEKTAARQKLHQVGAHYVVQREWMGAALYGNSFAARGKFLDYTREFELRLAAANVAVPGQGILIFCGTGTNWNISELEDFADFYHTGRHRPDDPFAKMEAHEITTERIELLRNITAFGYLKRGDDHVEAQALVVPVRGPTAFSP